MEYCTGKTGRIIVIRFDNNDDVLQGLLHVAKKESIQAGYFTMLGGLLAAEVVTGPVEATMPPVPVWAQVDGPREVVGVGSIFLDENDEPRIHLHAALGHHGQTTTACIRKGAKTYLILEAYLVEIIDIKAKRPWFADGQFYRLSFS